jgi:hypothetical protein
MKKAVFTIVHNERYFLPLWLKHYKKHFDKSDIYILNDNSSDGSTSNLDVNVINLDNHYSFDHHFLHKTVSLFQRELLKSYEAVMFAEADEFIITHPHCNFRLAEFIDKMPEDTVRCTGWQIIHNLRLEPPLDLEKPIMQQRHYGYYWVHFSKSLLSKTPTEWGIGFHDSSPKLECKDLLLIHLHYFDLDISYNRLYERVSRGICPTDPKDFGPNNKILDEKDKFKSLRFNNNLELPKEFQSLDL